MHIISFGTWIKIIMGSAFYAPWIWVGIFYFLYFPRACGVAHEMVAFVEILLDWTIIQTV